MTSPNANWRFENITYSQLDPLLEESQDVFMASNDKQSLSSQDLFEKFMRDDRFQVFGCVIDGRTVSYISIISYDNKDDARAIGPMYVSESARGSGIGKYQVKELISLMSQRGVTTLFTKTWSGNRRSRAIFDALGFRVVNSIKGDRINGDDTIEYERIGK